MTDLHPHRQHGAITPAAPGGTSYTTIVLILIALLCLYGLLAQWDAHADAEDQLIDAQLRYATDMGQAERDLATRVAAAYEQGQRDAMRVLESKPQGMELAQACQAWSNRNSIRPSRSALASASPARNRPGA
jgi:uncharacterized protein YheU (UPF0270 family)